MEVVSEKQAIAAVVERAGANEIVINLFKCSVHM